MRAQSAGGGEASGSRVADEGEGTGRTTALGVREDTCPLERAAADRNSSAPTAAAGGTASAISGAFPANFAAVSLPTTVVAIMSAGADGEVAAQRPGAKLEVGQPSHGIWPTADRAIVFWEMSQVVRGAPYDEAAGTVSVFLPAPR